MRIIALIILVSAGFALAQDELQFSYVTFKSKGAETTYQGVSIELPGTFLLTADEAIYNTDSRVITARGNVKIDYTTTQGLIEVTAYEVVYQQDSKSGMCEGVTAQFGDEFFFIGASLEILEGGDRFIIEDGQLTACNQALPQWSMTIKRAKVQKEGYAFIKGAGFRVKNLPIFYFPYFIAPAMQKRRSGLLTPDSGNSARNGIFFSQPIYWAPRQDMDFTFTPHHYQDAGLRLDLEARYTPRKDAQGIFEGAWFDDRVIASLARRGQAPVEDGKPIEEQRFRAKWTHDQGIWGGTFHADVEAGSDFSVDRDYLEDTQRTRLRDYFYRASFQRPFGRNLLSIRADRLERILTGGDEVQEFSRLPEVRYYQPSLHLGKGFHWRNYAYAGLFNAEDLGLETDQEGNAAPLTDDLFRVGLDSELSRGQNWSRFLHSRWGARYQGAWYRRDAGQEGTHGSAYAFLETVGPRLQKVYKNDNRRLVHYVDLTLTMKMGTQDEDPFLESIAFDELDLRIAQQSDGFRTAWKVNSRLFTGSAGKVRPLMELEISQDADFNSEENQPIETRFRLLNLGGFHANGIFDFNPDTGTLDTLSFYSSVNRGDWQGYGGYVKRKPGNESFIGISQWRLARWRSRFKIALDYDFDLEDFKSQEFLYGYDGQCVGLAMSYVKSPFDSAVETRDFFRLIVRLRNLSELGAKF